MTMTAQTSTTASSASNPAQQSVVLAAIRDFLSAWKALPNVPGYVKPTFDQWLERQLDAHEAVDDSSPSEEDLAEQARRSAEQFSALMGERFDIVPLDGLPSYHQMAVIYYMTIQTGQWNSSMLEECVDMSGEEGAAGMKKGLLQSLEHYVCQYGETLWGSPRQMKAEQVRQAVFRSSDIAKRFSNLDEYLEWYKEESQAQAYEGSLHTRLAVVLSCDSGTIETRDWGRLVGYLLAGHDTIPVVFRPTVAQLVKHAS